MSRVGARMIPVLLPCGLLIVATAARAQTAATGAVPDRLVERLECAPMTLPSPPLGGMHVAGGMIHGHYLFAPGEQIVIDAGTDDGIKAGQRYSVRRVVRNVGTMPSLGVEPVNIHTAGWVTVVDTREHSSTATIGRACDGILPGDYLEPYVEPTLPEAVPDTGGPDYDHAALIVLADEHRQAGAEGSLMLIDRGSDNGLRPGQALTIFRRAAGGEVARDVGLATVMSVRPQTSLIRIDRSNDAVYLGDRAAVHRIQP